MTVTTNQGKTGIAAAPLYLGAFAADPTSGVNGAALVVGNTYFNTGAGLTKTYNGSTWVSSDINTANLSAPSGSSLVGFQQSGTGAVARTVQDKAREVVSVKDFGAKGDGVTDDTAAIQAAITYVLANAGHTLQFDNATYLVGSSIATGGSVFTLNGTSSFVMRGRPVFRVTGTNSKQVTLFNVQMSNVDIEYVEAVGDAWTVPDLATALANGGIIAVYVVAPASTVLSNHKFGTVRVTNGLHCILYDANSKTSGTSEDVSIGLIDANNCAYAFNGAQSPSHHVIDQIIGDNIFRAYFVYGMSNGKANVFIKPTYTGIFAGGTCANIAVYTESSPGSNANRVGDTRNIEVNVHNTSNRPSLQLSTVVMAATDNAQGHYNIRANVMSSTGAALKVSNALNAGAEDTSTPYASPKFNITVRAHLAQTYNALDSTSYGIWSTTQGLTLECSNFLDNTLAVRQAYLTSGWQIRDLEYGYDAPRVLAVTKAGSTNLLKVAFNEDPHVSLGDDTSNNTRIRAGSNVAFFIAGSLAGTWNGSIVSPKSDNSMAMGATASRWQYVYTYYTSLKPQAVASLASAGTAGAGARGFVSDSTVAGSGNFGAIVAGGGTNGVPVHSDGTNWRIG